MAFLGAEAALSRAPDVRRDVAERILAAETRQDALAVVADGERRTAAQPPPRNDDVARVRVDGVLDQLRDRLARVRLRPGQPADEIERIGRTEHQRARGRLRHGGSVALHGQRRLEGKDSGLFAGCGRSDVGPPRYRAAQAERTGAAVAAARRGGQVAQFSNRRPETLPNSRSLFETRISFRSTAWAAISVSSGPMGVPARSSFARTWA